jgi:hypothetical protein
MTSSYTVRPEPFDHAQDRLRPGGPKSKDIHTNRASFDFGAARLRSGRTVTFISRTLALTTRLED